jgi:succinate-semialdehyde dehydrogenase/glutarate-semialdehyde dehydrogenase
MSADGAAITDYPRLHLHIDGEWIAAGDRSTHTVINPATGSGLGDLPLANAADLDRALDAAQRAYRKWRATPADERGQVMKRAAVLMRERVETIARIATLEEGKTLAETRIETQVAANLFEFYGEECRRSYGRVLVRPAGRRSLVIKEPVGPVAAFAPWNFPITNPARKLGGPIAAGCSVILKPAEEAPGAALEILRALIDAGLPAGVAQIVFGVPDEVSRHLLSSPVIRKLSFTGSIAVGKHLMKLAADNMLRTTMELGGHAPVLIFDDADLDKAMDELSAAKLRNAGQVCISPTRFLVQEGIYDSFVEQFVANTKRLKVGDGLEKGVNMGALANPRRSRAMEANVEDVTRHGAHIKTGGHRIGEKGNFFEPTVVTELPNDARAMNEEPFGPMAIINPFKTFEDAVREANRLPFGLAAYAWTKSAKTANAIAASVETGMISINHVGLGIPETPFGGVKDSGYGSEGGSEAIEPYMNPKFVSQAGL